MMPSRRTVTPRCGDTCLTGGVRCSARPLLIKGRQPGHSAGRRYRRESLKRTRAQPMPMDTSAHANRDRDVDRRSLSREDPEICRALRACQGGIPERPDARFARARSVSAGSSSALRVRANGAWTVTSMSTTSAGTGRCCSAIARRTIRRGGRSGRSRWARISAPRTSWSCGGRGSSSALVPCAERVRFTSSGTEATHLAMRLVARLHRQGQGRAFPRAFPRLARPGRGRQRLALRRQRGRRRAARHRRGDHSDADRRRADDHLAAGRARRHRRGDPRAVGRLVGTGAVAAGISPGAARSHRAARRGADLRRGHHGLPLVSAGGAQRAFGITRRHVHDGEDRRRRVAGRRAGRASATSWTSSTSPPGKAAGREKRRPSRHVQRQPAGGGVPASRRWNGSRRPTHAHAPATRRRSYARR